MPLGIHGTILSSISLLSGQWEGWPSRGASDKTVEWVWAWDGIVGTIWRKRLMGSTVLCSEGTEMKGEGNSVGSSVTFRDPWERSY